ncbi:MAG: ABC transporter ATP-binding protein [Coriobacteriia bacterium]|nr:ABC transporter ATP-binding protein [Coriobacteriia bacterium]
MNKVIEITDVTKIYRTGDEDTVALDGISLSIEQGEFVAIMGPSGSGKSSLMHIIGLLDTATRGKYCLDGTDVSQLGKGKQSEIRNQEIGFVFQQFNLLPRTSVLDNILLPTIYGKIDNPDKRANDLAEEVGLGDKKKNKSNQLSGGQIQRVAVARALVMDPSIILADEPTGNLDTRTSNEIMALFQEINKKGATIVLITHEADIAAFADRIIYLRDGKIVKEK